MTAYRVPLLIILCTKINVYICSLLYTAEYCSLWYVHTFYLSYYFILQTHLLHTAANYCSMHSIRILLHTTKRKFCILVLYYCEYVKWIHDDDGDGDGESHKKLRGPRHGMSGDKPVPYRPWHYSH